MTRRRSYGSGYGKGTHEKPGIEFFLEKYGVEFHDRDGWQPIRCPNPDHDDYAASASASLGEGKWKCHGCGAEAGDVYSLVMTAEQVPFVEAKRIVHDALPNGEREVPPEEASRATRPRFLRVAPARLRGSGHY